MIGQFDVSDEIPNSNLATSSAFAMYSFVACGTKRDEIILLIAARMAARLW